MVKRINWQNFLNASSGDIRRLSYIDRFSSIPVSFKETVAEHQNYVSIYSLMIHNEVEGPPELLADLLRHAATHDLSESVCGDVVRTFKYSSKEFKEAVDKAEANLVKKMDNKISSLIYEGDNWYIKNVVKVADFLSLYQYMLREVKRGNVEIRPFFNRMLWDLGHMSKSVKLSVPTEYEQLSSYFSEFYDHMSITPYVCVEQSYSM